MATVIFDFDSTLITVESLEKILAEILVDRPEVMSAIEAVTAQGMAGSCTFTESLSKRLALAAPRLEQVRDFGKSAEAWLTPGMGALVRKLRQRQVRVAIVSGGLVEAILPLAHRLNIPDSAVHAVRLRWDPSGAFAGIDPSDPFSQSKVQGLKQVGPDWSRPVIAIGDGMTDFELYQQGFADHFIAFTKNVKRGQVVQVASYVANSVEELESVLERWI